MSQTLEFLRRVRDAVGGKSTYSVNYPMLLLALAEHHSEMPMTEVANALGVSTAATTGIVDVAESKGLVARGHCTSDRRVRLVRITIHGKRVVKGGKA